LDCTPPTDQGVRVLSECVGNEVFQHPGLVAAEGESGVAVLTLGPDAGTAEVVAEPVQWVDRARAKQQRVTLEVVEGHLRLLRDRG
jgi:hypothetical protein